MRARRILAELLLALAAAVLSPLTAVAATCNVTNGSQIWSSVTANIADCTEAAGDQFIIGSGDFVTVTGDLTFTGGTGSITVQTGGTLIFSCGVTVSGYSFIANEGGTIEGSRCIVASGRIASTPTYATGPKRSSFGITADLTNAGVSTTTDYVVFDYRDDPTPGRPITKPIQVGPGAPSPGYYRQSFAAGTQWPVQAVSGSTLTVNTDPYTDVESLGASNAYSGTRGPVLAADTAITGAPTLATATHGTQSLIVMGNVIAIDADAGAQYVEFRTGACAGRLYKVQHTMNNGGGAGVDHIYVAGDATQCGSGVDVRINYGFRVGDPVMVVRPIIFDGSDIGDIRWSGGRVRLVGARFEHSDDVKTVGSQTFYHSCNVCIFTTSTSTPDFANSWITDSEFAYGNPNATDADSWFIGFMNFNSAGTGYLNGSPVDVSGFRFERNYIHDAATLRDGGGLHGIANDNMTGITLTQTRIERMGDDGVYSNFDTFGALTRSSLTIRAMRVYELAETTGSSQTQQCIDVSVADSGTGTSAEVLYGTYTIQDFIGVGCGDNILAAATMNSTFDRMAMGGATFAPGFGVGDLAYTNDPPRDSVNTYPNVISNLYAAIWGPAASTPNPIAVGGTIRDSMIVGNALATTTSFIGIKNAVRGERFFADISTAAAAGGGQLLGESDDAHTDASVVNFIDTVLINSKSGRGFCNGYSSFGTNLAAVNLTRVFLGLERYTGNGALEDSSLTCITGTDTTQPINIAGVTINYLTSVAAGLGRGGSNAGTSQGSRVSYACVQSTQTRTSATAFGANVTATSHHLATIKPDANDDSPIASFVRVGGDESDCNLARPRVLGLAKIGPAHASLGDGFAAAVQTFTTDADLLQVFGGTGGGNPLCPAGLGCY